MEPITFACPRCDRRMTVGAESAGRPVRCPQCKEVVATPAAPPGFDGGPRERPESIFAEPGEEDSVFESGRAARVEFPPEPPPPPPRPEPPSGLWSALSDPAPVPLPLPAAPFAAPPDAPRRNWLLTAVSVYA